MSSDHSDMADAKRATHMSGVDENTMDRHEAQKIAQDALEFERQKGYDELRVVAPQLIEVRRVFGILKRRKWHVPDDHYTTRTQIGQSGTTYYIEREVSWDADYGGPLRVWVYVHDGELQTMKKPEYALDLIYSSK